LNEFESKVIELLESINEKLDKLLVTPGVSILSSDSAAKLPEDKGIVKPSEVLEKLEEEERKKTRPSPEGRRVCPKCNSTDFREEEDKEKVVFQQGGIKMYAKRYVCKNCGHVIY